MRGHATPRSRARSARPTWSAAAIAREQLVAPGVEQVHPPAQAGDRPRRAQACRRSSPRESLRQERALPVARARIARAPRPALEVRPVPGHRSRRSPARALACATGGRSALNGQEPRPPLQRHPADGPRRASRASAAAVTAHGAQAQLCVRGAVAMSPGRTSASGRTLVAIVLAEEREIFAEGRGEASAPARRPAAGGPSRDRRARSSQAASVSSPHRGPRAAQQARRGEPSPKTVRGRRRTDGEDRENARRVCPAPAHWPSSRASPRS